MRYINRSLLSNKHLWGNIGSLSFSDESSDAPSNMMNHGSVGEDDGE